jgi:hypothetical protein
MQETLITLETAKLAREKEFNIPVRSMYLEEKLYIDTNSKGNYNDVKWVRTWRNSPIDDTISAPTQSLLQAWLRDVHNIEIAVQWFDNCYIKAVAKKPFKSNTYRVEGINTYEEALELALQEALTLIP